MTEVKEYDINVFSLGNAHIYRDANGKYFFRVDGRDIMVPIKGEIRKEKIQEVTD